MYAALKYLHITCVILSGLGFFMRGLLMAANSPLLARRWIRIAPHANDSILLAAAIALVVTSGQYPFVAAWVTAKVFGLIAYIILGSVALRAGRSKRLRIAAWLAAMVAFVNLVAVALTKSPLGLVKLIGG